MARSLRPPADSGASLLLFAALGDPNRLGLVSRLCRHGPSSIARLTAGSGITRQAVTKHLRLMEQAGLVRSRQRGRERIWQLEPRPFEDARHYLARISREWEGALERLRAFVEEA